MGPKIISLKAIVIVTTVTITEVLCIVHVSGKQRMRDKILACPLPS